MTDAGYSDSQGPVLVIGAAGMDIVGRLKGDLQSGSSSPGHIRSSFGGVARNVAENLARLGQPVQLLTVIGDDTIGEQLLQQISSAGVDVSSVQHSFTNPTGSYLAIIDASGVLQFALDDMHAIAELSPEYIRDHEQAFDDASAVFVDANLSKEALKAVFTLARRYDVPVCADPTSATLASCLTPYLNQLYLVTPNSHEAMILCGKDFDPAKPRQALEAAKTLVAQGTEIAIITLAEFGLCYATSETSGHIPAIRTTVVDPTGAGDALTAAVLYALLNDITLDDAVRLGLAAASLTLRHRGAVVPDLSLEKLYDQW